MILGCIFSPLIIAGSAYAALKLYSLFFLLLYFPIIPICIVTLQNIKHSKDKNEVVSSGVLSMLFVSFIGGILILAINDMDYEIIDTCQNVNKKVKKTTEIVTIKQEKQLDQFWIKYYQNMSISLLNSSREKITNNKNLSTNKKIEALNETDVIQQLIEKIVSKSDYETIKRKLKSIVKNAK